MDGMPIIQQFQDALNTVLDSFRDQGITFGEAIGALEQVKLDLWHESAEEDTF